MKLSASIKRVAAIVRKELLVLFGDRISRMMLVIPPILQIFTFGYAATLEVKNIHIGILNRDNGYYSRELINRVSASPSFTNVSLLGSEADLTKAINSQQVLLALVFDQDFSRLIEKRKSAPVQAIMDGRRSNSSQLAASYVNQIISAWLPELPKNAQNAPSLEIKSRFWFNPNLEFQWFFLPNLIGIISLMMGLIVTGLSVAREREMGTFSQLLVSPATPWEIALGKLTPGFIVGMIEGFIFWLIARYAFGVPFEGAFWLFCLNLLVFTLAASAMGLMISSLCQTQQQAFLGAFTVGVPFILISGAVTPLINMPQILQNFSQLNPLRHFTIINQGLFLKDITLQAAFMSLGKILLISCFFMAVAIWMFKRRA